MADPNLNALFEKYEALKSEKPEPPKNVFIFSSSIFGPADYLEKTRQMIKSQIEQGVVVLPSYVTLEAVTGPCTDVEVIIKQEERT